MHTQGMATRKASGRNIKESERNTAAVKLRIDPMLDEELRDFAEREGMTLSQAAEWCIFNALARANPVFTRRWHETKNPKFAAAHYGKKP